MYVVRLETIGRATILGGVDPGTTKQRQEEEEEVVVLSTMHMHGGNKVVLVV